MSQRRLAILLVLGVVGAAALLLPSRLRPASTRPSGFLIVCDFLPTYVFTRNVVGNTPGVSVELLVSANVGCPHDYSVRPADMQRLARADVVVTNGLGLDAFLKPLLAGGPRARVITISDDCNVLPAAGDHDHEEPPDSEHTKPSHAEHQPASTPHEEHHDDTGHEHGPASAHHHEAGAHEHGDVNPHVWVSPAEAIRQVRTLTRKLSEIDAQHAGAYQANAGKYVARLEALLKRMQEAARFFQARKIVTFHDAFAYLARDLDLQVVATLTQEPEHAPSAHQMAELIRTIKEKQAAAVFYEPAYTDRVARTVARDAGVPVYPLNPFNSLQGEPGLDSYEQVMEENLRTLQQALGGRQ